MNLLNLMEEIADKEPDMQQEATTRRGMMNKVAGSLGKLALAAVPVGLAGIFEKAAAAPPSTSTVLGVLNFALTLEYLEAAFYEKGLQASGLIPAGADRQALTTIAMHEAQHVSFLTGAIQSLGGTPVAKPAFDFTAGSGSGNGPFKSVFTSYQTFLAVAQAFEDTGVRAYKGQAANLLKGGMLLTYALDIHSVEARHASHIRQMRTARGFAQVKPWITGNQSGIGSPTAANYAGEENTLQSGIQIVNINGQHISANAASEAFDEPLTMAQVLAIVKPFLA